MRDGLLPVYPSLLAKMLAATTGAALIGCAVAFRIHGELALRDIIGTAISSLLFAYLLHLWIALGRERLS
jgi:hypothetical protein